MPRWAFPSSSTSGPVSHTPVGLRGLASSVDTLKSMEPAFQDSEQRGKSSSQELPMPLAWLISIGIHLVLPITLLLVSVVLLVFFGFDIQSLLRHAPAKPHDLEFVLLPPTHTTLKPLNRHTFLRSTADSRASGQKNAALPVNLIEKKRSSLSQSSKVASKLHARSLEVAHLKVSDISSKTAEKKIVHDAQANLTSQVANPNTTASLDKTASVDAIQEPDFGPYMDDLQRRIKDTWHPTRANESKEIVVVFKINKTGSLDDLKIKESSGAQEDDQAALATIQQIFPFRPLPPAFSEDNIEIEYTFHYNVFGDKQTLNPNPPSVRKT